LHLLVKSGFDHIANKPHASPADHAYNYLLDNFLDHQLQRLGLQEANIAMAKLRAFSQNGEAVFQSYHSTYDPDHHNFFPSGTVGIPPVKAGYLAHAYRYAKEHGYEVPDAHFWAIMGDSEFREGSLFEAVPDFAEREIGNLTWILDYNRQSLDGHRITNKKIMQGTDDSRVERTMKANGWEVIQVRHGKIRQNLFQKNHGESFKLWLEEQLEDYELQALLLLKDPQKLYSEVQQHHPEIKEFLKGVSAEEFSAAIYDFGGHDIFQLAEALEQSKKDTRRPTMIIAHTLKGWNLRMAAQQGNHSALPSEEEMLELRSATGLKAEEFFARFSNSSPEGKFLKTRGEEIYQQIVQQNELKNKNAQSFLTKIDELGGVPAELDINLKMASYPHTQWMLGQLTAKMTRIANTPLDESQLTTKQKALSKEEKSWKIPSELMVSLAPDVGTSTNLNPSMDGHIFAPGIVEDFENEYHVKDNKLPDLVPGEEVTDRYIRFEIAESNAMSCLGAYGRLRDTLGIPILPLMTVYDFFIKRALDQYFYDLYWKSSFILCGTPSGVTLSPEGAQHGWKSDIQIPNQITWEPFYCVELDWILSDAIRRHVYNDNQGRSGVLIRGVTRGIEQKDMLKLLRQQRRFKQNLSDDLVLTLPGQNYPQAVEENQAVAISDTEILAQIRNEVLAGGYYLISYSGYFGYEPGDNVVNIFAMGSLTTEAIIAAQKLLEEGVYANVIVVTSPDLLLGNLAHENNYFHLRETLQINSELYLQPQLNGNLQGSELVTIAGRRVPIVSVHDGEPGLLDNIGSIIGVKQEALAVRKHSKCGRPSDVYQFHGIDADSVLKACKKVLAETALEQIKVSRRALGEAQPQMQSGNWQSLWPTLKKQ
ncbi:MAG: pyruvate dehydrogenase, partial [Bdellovibrionales bacterium]|nr:pyruvate dehydrogenase [Bdellovibrionales bacterium]